MHAGEPHALPCLRSSGNGLWPAGRLCTQPTMQEHALVSICALPKQNTRVAGTCRHTPAHLRSSIAMLPDDALDKPGMGVADQVALYSEEATPTCRQAT